MLFELKTLDHLKDDLAILGIGDYFHYLAHFGHCAAGVKYKSQNWHHAKIHIYFS